MTVYQLDVATRAIKSADRGQLSIILDTLLHHTQCTVSELEGLRSDIRDRADWLRKRGKR